MFEESLGLLQAFQCLFTVYPFQQNIVFSFSREEWFAEYFWGPPSRGCPALYEDRPHERLVASKLRQDSLQNGWTLNGRLQLQHVVGQSYHAHLPQPQRITKAYPQIDYQKMWLKNHQMHQGRAHYASMPSKVHIGSPEIRIQEQASTPQQWTENKTQTCETCEVSSNAATEDGMEMDSKMARHWTHKIW